MNHFPIQRVPYSSPQHFCLPQQTQRSQVISIQQLKQENDFLKRQLSELLKTQNHQKGFAIPPPVALSGAINPNEQDFQANFQRKLSKLKAKNVNRRSIDRFNQTTPASPRRMVESDQDKMRNVTNLQFRQSPFKMIIQQDQKGRFFRNREREDSLETARNVTTQPNFYQRCSQDSQRETPHIHLKSENVYRYAPPRPKTHQRAASSHEYQVSNTEEPTKRIFAGKNDAAFRSTEAQGLQRQRPPYPFQKQQNFTKKISTTQIPIIQEPYIPYSNRQQPDIRIKPTVCSPRGNIYVEQKDAFEDMGMLKHPSSQQSIEGDSFVSIEKTLKEKKSVRKLRYDIYMSDDK